MGLAKYVEWSANLMEHDDKQRLKAAELQAKKDRLRMWTNYVPPSSNSMAIHDQNFTGKVVEVVSGDCLIVADDAVPHGSPAAERKVNLSSIRAPKIGNPRRDEKPAPYAREAREFLRTSLIGQQVNVSLEYSRNVSPVDDPNSVAASASADSKVLDFGTVFLVSPPKGKGAETSPAPPAGSQQGNNVAEMVVSRGFATVVRHRDFEERSNYYDVLLAAECRATNRKKGIHSARDPPAMHITDLTTGTTKKARNFFHFLRSKRLSAVVEYVLSGHRFKLLIPKETCYIAFAFSGARCPGRDEPFSDEAIALMRRKILQRDVEIEVVTVDKTGTFLGSLWVSGTNMAVTLLEAGLARFQASFGADKIADAHLLSRAEQSAKRQKLKIWDSDVEGQEVSNVAIAEAKNKEVYKVVVTEVLGGGKFYAQKFGDPEVASIQQQLAMLNLNEAPIVGAFNPSEGDIVLAQFSVDDSWYRAMIVNGPCGAVTSPQDLFEVFYMDYGNQESIPFSRLRPLAASISTASGLAHLCKLAYVKVPDLEEDCGPEAAKYLSQCVLNSTKEFKVVIHEVDASGGQGTGTIWFVALVDVEASASINATMLEEGLARVERTERWKTRERKTIMDDLQGFQDKAKRKRLGIWRYGDVQSDEEEPAPPRKATGGRR